MKKVSKSFWTIYFTRTQTLHLKDKLGVLRMCLISGRNCEISNDFWAINGYIPEPSIIGHLTSNTVDLGWAPTLLGQQFSCYTSYGYSCWL